MRRFGLIALGLLVLALGAFVTVTLRTHWVVRHARAPLPETAAIEAAVRVADGPVRISYVNTASQRMPRSAVLDTSLDPHPEAPYVMSHPSFVLEWQDGRILLVDVGMTEDAATDFGAPMEHVGADPIQPITSTAKALGPACTRVEGIIFSHLHSDHVGGIEELCRCAGHPIRVFMNPTMAAVTTLTTAGGLELLRDSACVTIETLRDGSLRGLDGFPGVAVAHAGGHTPGSQAVFTAVGAGGRAYAFGGDLANNIDGVRNDIPKPFLYSLLLVPEDGVQLSRWRGLLRTLGEAGFGILLAHDQLAIEALPLEKFATR